MANLKPTKELSKDRVLVNGEETSLKLLFDEDQQDGSKLANVYNARMGYDGGFHIENKTTVTEKHSYVGSIISNKLKEAKDLYMADPEDEDIKADMTQLMALDAKVKAEGKVVGNNLVDYLTRSNWGYDVICGIDGTVTLRFRPCSYDALVKAAKDKSNANHEDAIILLKKAEKVFTFKNSVKFLSGKPEKDVTYKIPVAYDQKGFVTFVGAVNDRSYVSFEVEKGILFPAVTTVNSNGQVTEPKRSDWRYEHYIK